MHTVGGYPKVDSQVCIPVQNLDQFLSNIISLNLSAENDLQRDAGCHLLAAIANKRIGGVFTPSTIIPVELSNFSYLRRVVFPVLHAGEILVCRNRQYK